MNLPALFLKLVNMSISASWLVLAVLVLRLMIRKAPKWMTCSLWALVALRLVIPFSIESMFSLIPSTQTLPPEIITGNRFEVNTGIPVVNQQINDVLLDHYYEGVTVPVDNGLNAMSIASLVWLVGLGLLVLYSIVSYLRLRRRVAASIHLRDRIYLCDYIESPFILGILCPRIYLPSTLEQTNWPHVLAHEQAHLQRRDHWWKPFGFALLCIHWFNPLLWLAYVLLCRDIELACDEKVIQGFGDSGKAAYSKALLECSMPRYLIAACPLAFGEVGVKDRVKSILNYKKPAFWVILIALILSITAAVCFLTDPVTEPEAEFIATVIGTYQNYISVEPHPDSNEAKSSHQIHVTLPKNTPAIQNGDTVRIVYDGVILESSPAQIPGASRIEVLTDLKYVSENYSLTRAILENYVVMVDSDVVSGQALMHEFFRKTENREPASIRYATYFTIGDPDRMSDELFESSRANYPAIYFHELSYDGNKFTLRWFEGDTEYIQTWKYLLRFEGKPASPSVSFMAFDGYMLTDRNDVTYEMVWNGMFSADFRDQIPFKEVYRDYLYNNEPTLAELEAAKLELEPYMVRYRIASIDANELTGRLDIQVYEWVDGLFDIIEQYVSRHFVTVTELRGTLELTTYNSIDEAILDGCVTSVNGDLVAGKAAMTDFYEKTASGQPASVRVVDFYTNHYAGYNTGDFLKSFPKAPSMSVTDLIYDGSRYIQRMYSNGRGYTNTYQYMLRYSNVSYGELLYPSLSFRDYFILTDYNDLTWEEHIQNMTLSSASRQGFPVCTDALHEHEPDLAALEQVKTALTPYMQQYSIVSMEVNSLRGQLDIRVSEWVVGVDALVSQYIDPAFVTITHANSWQALEKQNKLVNQYPEYFGLDTFKGLELYALKDGYVLTNGTNRLKEESELVALPKVSAEEMAMILETYEITIDRMDIQIINRTNRTEYEIRKELGIYPECRVYAKITGATPEKGTLTITIHNLDNKEVWAGPEFQLKIRDEDGWEPYGKDPDELAWNTALLFHRQGTGQDPGANAFLTQETLEFTVDWSLVSDTPLSSGQYLFCKTVYIREGENVFGYNCDWIFIIP